MKKFCKFLLGTISLATLACGAYYFFKKYMCKESKEDFDDFDDDFDEDDTEEVLSPKDTREYVSINITSEQGSDTEDAAEASDDEMETAEENVQEEDQ